MVSGVLLGGLLGLTVQLYSNAVRKLPLMRHPWEHVLWTAGGAWGGNAVVEWEKRATVEVEEILKQRQEKNKPLEGQIPAIRT
ncbi:hypothetical protein WJX74_004980 [Apatococcus lobatus]|uniref:Uncharacterized protein n=1 Tax=Apatococcus lobatus TaxID=904363 RepID=A0AAW1QHN4_9CHLO